MRSLVLAVLLVVACSTNSTAQLSKGDNVIDMRIGNSTLGSINIGFDYDWVWKKGGEFGPGAVTIGANLDYSHYSYSVGGISWGQNYVPFGPHIGYHFAPMMTDKAWDPFVNLGFAFIMNRQASSVNENQTVNADGFDLTFTAGVKYYFSPKWHALASIGMNSSYLCVGVGYTL